MIVLTDGRSNIGIGLNSSINYANDNNVIVHTIGIGTENGYFIDLNESIGPLGVNVNELNDLSIKTGGKFYYPRSLNELNNVYSEIAKSEKTKVSLDLTFFLLIFILVALITEWILINTRYRIIP